MLCAVNAAVPADLAAPTDLVMMPARLDADLSLRQAVSAVGGAVELDSDESDAQAGSWRRRRQCERGDRGGRQLMHAKRNAGGREGQGQLDGWRCGLE